MIVDSAAVAASLLAPYFEALESEAVAVLHLDPQRRLLGTTFPGSGGAGEVDLPVRDILASALRIGAEGIVVAHNHPSGSPEPSPADRAATRRLADATGAAGVRLVDHLVFGGGKWRSFRELGLL